VHRGRPPAGLRWIEVGSGDGWKQSTPGGLAIGWRRRDEESRHSAVTSEAERAGPETVRRRASSSEACWTRGGVQAGACRKVHCGVVGIHQQASSVAFGYEIPAARR
jgi:hypothetical protein